MQRRRLSGLAAAVAYNAMLALFPAILAMLTTISFLRSAQGMLERLASRLGQIAPEEVLFLVQRFAAEVTRTDGHRLFSISFIAAIWIASSAIGAVMNALDLIQQTPTAQMRPYMLDLAFPSPLLQLSGFVLHLNAYRGTSGNLSLWSKRKTKNP